MYFGPPIPHVDRFRELYAALTGGGLDSLPPVVAVDAAMLMLEFEHSHEFESLPGSFLGLLETPNMEGEQEHRIFTHEEIRAKNLVLYRGSVYTRKQPDYPAEAAMDSFDPDSESLAVGEERRIVNVKGREWAVIWPVPLDITSEFIIDTSNVSIPLTPIGPLE
jgi:hypothetical protein